MKTSLRLLGSTALAFAFLAGCEATKEPTDTTVTAPAEVSSPASGSLPRAVGPGVEKNGIRLTSFEDSPRYLDARMRAKLPEPMVTLVKPDVTFEYEVTNFKLTTMTESDHSREMANSAKGQHIHLIVDNQPYVALYDTKYTKKLEYGPHVALSFLSRSYHESLKHEGAYDLRAFFVGDVPAGTPPLIDVTKPTLFYSRPKDTYAGADAKRIMLDFYLVNTDLAPNGNKVRATINGTEFLLDKWAPYMMEGLPAGENTVKLELLDSSGELLPGLFNSVTRTFTVQPQS